MGGSFPPGLVKAGGSAETARAGPPTPDQRPAGLLGWAPRPLSPKGTPEPPCGLRQQWARKIKLIRQLCLKALFCQRPPR